MPDLRIALRSLRRTPGFTAIVILSLGIGIGASTVAYSWIDAFILNPLPGVPQSNRLVSVYTKGPGGATWSLSYPRFKQWREVMAGTASLAVHDFEQLSLKTEGFGPERVFSEVVSGNYFDVLGTRAIAGRTLTLEDERQAAQVAVISDRLWDRAFGRDPSIVGRQVTINGNGFTIVGIAPAKFGGAMTGLAFEAWIPVTTISVVRPGNTSLTADGWQWLEGIARPREGATYAQTRSAIEDASKNVSQTAGERTPTLAGVRRISQTDAGPFVTPLFLTLFGLAAIILLIACANIANLLLVRATKRAKEMGVRLALGADRWRIVRQLMTESLVLAGAGGLLGLLIAYLGRGTLNAVMPALPFPVNLTSEVSLRVVGVAAAITIGTALIVGLVPALRASRAGLVVAIRHGDRAGSPRSLLRSSLVVAQVALSLIALVSAGLFMRSLSRARQAEVGFDGLDRVLAVGTSFQLAGLPDSVARIKYDQILERIRAIPGVERASTIDDLPLSLGGNSSSYTEIPGYLPGPDENMSVLYGRAGADYFETMGIPVLKGRGFTTADRPDGDRVLVVNEAFASKYLRGRDPLGLEVRFFGEKWTVVGVAGNVARQRIGETPAPYLYLPAAKAFASELTVVIRAGGAPRFLVEPLRAAIQSVDPNLPVLDPRTMRDNLASITFAQSIGATLLGVLGAVALGLAAIGLYGVLAFAVAQRNREIGIRIALGAASNRVVGLVLRQAARLVVLGVVLGAGLAFGVANLLRAQLFGVQPADPVTFLGVVVLLGLVAVVASVLPARRASRVDPVVTLKSE